MLKRDIATPSQGQLQSASHADGTTSSYRYDLLGRLIEETTPKGSIWKTAYDDAAWKVTRTLYGASGSALGGESQTFDARGNIVERTDRAGNRWTMTYDALNRIKSEQGPSTAQGEQNKTYIYSRSDCVTICNGVGEWNNLFTDALGRPIQTTLFNASGGIAKSSSNHYPLDHHSVTTLVGSGKNTITTTLYSDSFSHPLLLKHADGNYQLSSYDGNGNRTSFRDEEGRVTNYSYDALNQLASEARAGGAVIKYSYNLAGELERREMPKGITEQNEYNSAGQKIASLLLGSDKKATRLYRYHYGVSGNAAGKIDLIDDPRGFKSSLSYDDWGHITNIVSSGATIPEQNQTTSYTYDSRGLLTSLAQHYNDPSTGPSTEVSRTYDAYGQLTSEATSLNDKAISSWTQTWNGAGRRTALN
jgi:YD repeat-containing protein